MTVHVNLSSEQEERLRKCAAASGQDLNSYVTHLIEAFTADQDLLSAAEQAAEIRQTYPLQEAVAHAHGWDDPRIDKYNDYDAHRREKSSQ